jgi:anti-anti-sigma regulatory factor
MADHLHYIHWKGWGMEVFLLNNSTKVIKISKDLDLDRIRILKNDLKDLDFYQEVLIDMTDLDCINSNFINLLVRIKRQRPLDYQKIKLLNPNSLVNHMLDLNNLSSVYDVQKIYPTAW